MSGGAFTSKRGGHGIGRHEIGHRPGQADLRRATAGLLEPQHRNRFVAIEPESGEYFLGDTFDEAVKSARAKHPSRLSHTIRIGHRAAFHMGGMLR